MPRRALRLIAILAFAPSGAHAAGAACWFEHGVVVVPASVAGIDGDYILDTGAPQTQVHETRAEGAGFEGEAITGEVRMAGLSLKALPVAVADLDARTWDFDTPIAGVIGMDVLGGRVVDVSFAPCRVTIRPARRPGPFRAVETLPLIGAKDGPPVVTAAVSDGESARRAGFVAATGSDTAVRLSDQVAEVKGQVKAEAVYPYGGTRPVLRALSFAGGLDQFAPSGLEAAASLPPEAIGVIGAPVLSRYRLRFDFPRRRLLLGAP
ncbi:hypothetical protein [Phenylobacterium sp.]|uniref:hypothetical protein n=1 Tax=Phenylobacterium sp. TaxID=1871053 RepID=UPI0035B3DABF